MGDFYRDLLKSTIHEYTNIFLEQFLEKYYKPMIIKPTRFSIRYKPTLIDNIF